MSSGSRTGLSAETRQEATERGHSGTAVRFVGPSRWRVSGEEGSGLPSRLRGPSLKEPEFARWKVRLRRTLVLRLKAAGRFAAALRMTAG